MKRLNQTESPIFVILCVLCFQRQSFLTFILPGCAGEHSSRDLIHCHLNVVLEIFLNMN